MPTESFDFQAYVAAHKDPDERTRSLSFGDYAYRADIKHLRTLHTLAPVRVLVAGTLQLWGGWGRSAILKGAVKASPKDAQRVYDLAHKAGQRLHMPPTQVYVTGNLKNVRAQSLGDRDEAFVTVHTEAVRSLDDDSLLFHIGRQLGHIQNDHVLFQTAAFYGDEIAGSVVRWAIRPGLFALNQWRQRAALTADRAGLLACQSLPVATRQIVEHAVAGRRLEEDVDVEAFAKELEEGRDAQGILERLSRHLPSASLRIHAVQRFAETQYYLDHIGEPPERGLTLSEVDDQIDDLLKGRGTTAEKEE